MMKRLLALLIACALLMGLAACGGTTDTATDETEAPAENTAEAENSEETEEAAEETEEAEAPESITINALDGNKEAVEVEVPYDAQRIAVMDLAVLDILDSLDLGDRVVGVSKGSSIDYLQDYVTNDDIVNLGTIKECDLEAVMSCEPDVIFIGGRLSAQYDALSEIAPVVFLATDTEIGLVESTSVNATTIASIFGLEDTVSQMLEEYDARITALQAVAEGKTAVVGICTSGSFNTLGNDGRCSIIGVEIGFENLCAEDLTSTHGNESSFELLVSLNPDYIFVMDRDAAISTEGAELAQEIFDNELVAQTDAYANDNIVFLSHPAVWYTAEGGIQALGVMLADLEEALLA